MKYIMLRLRYTAHQIQRSVDTQAYEYDSNRGWNSYYILD